MKTIFKWLFLCVLLVAVNCFGAGVPYVSQWPNHDVPGPNQFTNDANVYYGTFAGGIDTTNFVAKTASNSLSVIFPETFGGINDGTVLSNVTSTSSSAVISCPSWTFSSADVGKKLVLYLDTTNLTYLLTTISGVTPPHTATMATTSSKSWIGNGRVVFGTDNTTAIQSAMQAAFNMGGAVIQFAGAHTSQGQQSGIYMIGGTVKTNTPAFMHDISVLYVPQANLVSSTPAYQIVLRGVFRKASDYSVQSGNSSFSGTVLYCPSRLPSSVIASNAWYSVLSCNNSANTYPVGNLRCENINFKSPPNPQLSWISDVYGGGINVIGCMFDTDFPPGYLSALLSATIGFKPTGILSNTDNSSARAIITPYSFNTADVRIEDTTIVNWGTGIQALAGHTTLRNVDMQWCKEGLFVGTSLTGNALDNNFGGTLRILAGHLQGNSYDVAVYTNEFIPSVSWDGALFEDNFVSGETIQTLFDPGHKLSGNIAYWDSLGSTVTLSNTANNLSTMQLFTGEITTPKLTANGTVNIHSSQASMWGADVGATTVTSNSGKNLVVTFPSYTNNAAVGALLFSSWANENSYISIGGIENGFTPAVTAGFLSAGTSDLTDVGRRVMGWDNTGIQVMGVTILDTGNTGNIWGADTGARTYTTNTSKHFSVQGPSWMSADASHNLVGFLQFDAFARSNSALYLGGGSGMFATTIIDLVLGTNDQIDSGQHVVRADATGIYPNAAGPYTLGLSNHYWSTIYGSNIVIGSGGISNLWQVYTPEMFGAVGDGTNADGAAVQACENQVQNLISKGINAKSRWNPARWYNVNQLIIETNRFNIEGDYVPWGGGLGKFGPTVLFGNLGGFFCTNIPGSKAAMFGMQIKGVNFVSSNYLNSGVGGPAGQIAFGVWQGTNNSTSNYQSLAVVNCGFSGFDYSMVFTNINELNTDWSFPLYCTNGLIAVQAGVQGMQSCVIRRYQAVTFGKSLFIDGGNYSLESPDCSPSVVTDHAVEFRNAGVNIKNPNIEGASTDSTHYVCLITNSTITVEGGAMNQGNNKPAFKVLGASSALHIKEVVVGQDANSVGVIDGTGGIVIVSDHPGVWKVTNAVSGWTYPVGPLPESSLNRIVGQTGIQEGGDKGLVMGANATNSGSAYSPTLTANVNKQGVISSYAYADSTDPTVRDIIFDNENGANKVIIGGQTASGSGNNVTEIDLTENSKTWQFGVSAGTHFLSSQNDGLMVRLFAGPLIWEHSDNPNTANSLDGNGMGGITVSNASLYYRFQTNGGITSFPVMGIDTQFVTNTYVIASTGYTNLNGFTVLVSLSAATTPALKDQNGNQFLTPALSSTFPMRPGWRLTGTAITGIAVAWPP